MEVKLRLKNSDDEKFLFDVYAGTREEELSIVSWTQEQKEEFLRMQYNAQITYYNQIYPEMEYYIILRDDIPAGRLMIARLDEEIRVVDIAVISGQRGLGTGKFLLQRIIDEALPVNKKVVLHVEQNNRAQNLYKRLGFKVAAVEGFYLRMELAPEKNPTNEMRELYYENR